MELKRIAEGLTVIAVGLVFLGNTFGVIPWSVWWNVISLWPLLLIAAGIDVIGRGTDNSWLRVLSSLLVIAGLAYGVFVMPANGGNWSPWGPFVFMGTGAVSANSEPFDNSEAHDPTVRTGDALVSGGVGSLTVTAGSNLVSASGTSPFDPVFEVNTSSKGADVVVGLGNGQWVALRDNASLDVELDRAVAWDLRIDGGVSEIEADLSDLTLTALEIRAGVSKGTVILGAVDTRVTDGGVPVILDTGVSTFTVRIKEGEHVRLRMDKGLSTIAKPSDMRQVNSGGGDDVYESDGFSESAGYWDITLDAGISNVRIEYY